MVRHACVLSAPGHAAGAIPVSRILPRSTGVRLSGAVVPEPLTIWIEILHSLQREPVSPRVEDDAIPQVDLKVRRRPDVRPVEKRGDLCPR